MTQYLYDNEEKTSEDRQSQWERERPRDYGRYRTLTARDGYAPINSRLYNRPAPSPLYVFLTQCKRKRTYNQIN